MPEIKKLSFTNHGKPGIRLDGRNGNVSEAEITSPPPEGKFLVTIRIERSDGQFVSSSRLVPDDLATGDSTDVRLWYLASAEIGAKVVSAYYRAAELPS